MDDHQILRKITDRSNRELRMGLEDGGEQVVRNVDEETVHRRDIPGPAISQE